MSRSNSLKIKPSCSGATILGDAIYTPAFDKLRIRDNDCELTIENYKILSFTGYTGKTMKNAKDILMMNSDLNDLSSTGIGVGDTKKKTFFTITLPKLFEEIQNKSFEEITDDSDDFQGQGVEIIIPSNIIDIYTRLEIFFGLKLSGHVDTFTEASFLVDELYKRGEIQNKQQYQKAHQISNIINGASY